MPKKYTFARKVVGGAAPLAAMSGAILALATPQAALAAASSLTPHSAGTVRMQGVVSFKALAASADNRAALAANSGRIVEMPRHRYPDGSLTGRAPVSPAKSLAPNTDVRAAPPRASLSISGFTGIYEGSNLAATGGELEPPDQGLAVNNGEIAEIVNNTFQIFDTSGNALSAPLANATFFGTGSTYTLSDPHVVFDASTQRWFVEELMFNSSFNGFAVAISQTSDPQGSYNIYYIDDAGSGISACGGSCLPDYPQVGYDANGFYIAADLFSNSSGSFVDTGFYALPKAALEAGTSFTYVYFVLPDFVVQPAIPAPGQPFITAARGTEFAMTARNIQDGSTNLRVWAISNTNKLSTAPASLVAHAVDLPALSYTRSTPSTQPSGPIGPYCTSVGSTSTPKLDGGYNAFGGGVKMAQSGRLFGALTTSSPDSTRLARDIIAWFEVTPAASLTGVSASIAAQGYVIPPDGYSISYPAFALSKGGKGVMGMTITNTSKKAVGGFPSTAFLSFANNAPTGAITVVGAGAMTDDGFSGCPGGGPAGTGRWGDYAAGMVDPVTGYWYVANEFIPNKASYPRGHAANWGTYVTQVHP